MKRILLSILFMGSWLLHAQGQLLTNDNVDITVNNATITVGGGILNKAGTTIENSGTITLTGDWENNAGSGIFGNSAGTVVLDGANQDIGGMSSSVFHHLTVQGTGDKTLSVPVTAGGVSTTGVLTLTSAVLDLNGHTLYISNPDAAGIAYTNGSIRSERTDNASVVDWHMQSTTGVHTIPFSNLSGTMIPFEYNLVSGNHGHVQVATYATDIMNAPYPVSPNAVSTIGSLGTGDPSYMVHRYWQVDPEITGQASELLFSFDPVLEKPGGINLYYAQPWNNAGSWTPPSMTQSMPGFNMVKLTNNTTYGTWGLANGASGLPITLLSFTAKLNNSGQVETEWVTASEVNNDFFTVERTRNGTDAETVAIVDGAGNSSTTRYYEALDPYPLSGLSYYRLKQTDFDGQFSYSKWVAINNNKNSLRLKAYPNPVERYLVVEAPGSAEGLVVKIFDAGGRLVLEETVSTESHRLDLARLAGGLYTLVVTDAVGNYEAIKINKVH